MLSEDLLRRRKLNLGSGHDNRPDYINVDLHERHGPDLVADITKLDMLPSGQFDEILAQDVLEHLKRSAVRTTIKEWARLLAPNGILKIRVPSIVHMALALCEPHNRPAHKADELMNQIFGTQEYDGDFHLTGFTPALMVASLADAGLLVCRAEIVFEMNYEVTARKTDRLTDPAEIVHNLFFRLVDRPPDPEGWNFYFGELSSGRMTEAEAEADMKSKPEYRFLQEKPMYAAWHAS